MRKILKKLYKNSKFGYVLLYAPKKVWNLFNKIKMKNLTDEEFIKLRYKMNSDRDIDLVNPTRFTEKIQWLKLNHRDSLYTKCADKYLVRGYIKNKIGSEYLIPLLYVTNKVEDINYDNLPAVPHIIKTTHDSGGTFIAYDKNNIDLLKIRKALKKRMSISHYENGREWEYKNIKPRIIIEKLLTDNKQKKQLNDYKIHCFHGKPMFIQTIFDRGENTKENWYDTDWNLLDVYYFSPNKKNIVKPKLLNELLKIAIILSQDFPYVRVDLYIVNEKIYFGELTFRPYGGFMKFVPDEFDIKLGSYLKLVGLKN